MEIPSRFQVYETDCWLINHRLDSALPGYLMLGSKSQVGDLSELPDDALVERWPSTGKSPEGVEGQTKSCTDLYRQIWTLSRVPSPLSFNPGLRLGGEVVLARR